ncbi:MAG: integrase arm-type DNA-binding domain-containing protein, partial [Pseudomonadota bacterium]|nr:integrase arm-type DNA-binding domain-containing protein [Pseudomonadota bacterium]
MAARNLISGDALLRSIKPGDPRKRLNDGDGLSLLLFVKGGSHGWRFAYTRPLAARGAGRGVRNIISLGTYPDVSLSKARELAAEARQTLVDGVDPSDAREVLKAQHAARAAAEARVAAGQPGLGSFQAVAMEWLAEVHRAAVSASHAARTQTRFENDVFPWLGNRPLAAIEAPELLAVLRRITERGAIETAHRAKDACGQVFRYGIASGVCQR